jgi:D-aminoacyl-tRNA deacylase
MRTTIQRVASASVRIDGKVKSEIQAGLLILVGIEETDTLEDIEWLATKIINLRIFSDQAGLMNKSIQDTEGEILIISQFTLYASTKKGNRPSYLRSAKPDIAIPIYQAFIQQIEKIYKSVQTGTFGADMQVQLINDGPVTINIDSKNRE